MRARFCPLLNTVTDVSAVPSDPQHRYSAVVFTSGRAVEAVAAAVAGTERAAAWQQLQTFVVGKATASKVRSLLGVNEVRCGAVRCG